MLVLGIEAEPYVDGVTTRFDNGPQHARSQKEME
jgi:hypothetical protein